MWIFRTQFSSFAVFFASSLLAVWPLLGCEGCEEDGLSREAVLDWLKGRILDDLGLEEPPKPVERSGPGPGPRSGNRPSPRPGPAEGPRPAEGPGNGPEPGPAEGPGPAEAQQPHSEQGLDLAVTHQRHPEERLDPVAAHRRRSRHSRGHQAGAVEPRAASDIILFPSSDSTCMDPSSSSEGVRKGVFTYYFQASIDVQETRVILAHFWFHTGVGEAVVNAPLILLTTAQELRKVSDAPDRRDGDGWTTYHLQGELHQATAEGPFILQVRCAECECRSSEPEKTPFMHLRMLPKFPDRPRRTPPHRIPLSDALVLLQRNPYSSSMGKIDPTGSTCHMEKLDISFAELGWENWIVHPKEFTFSYCHGTCDHSQHSQVLGIKQCCAPVPGSMKSIRFTTTSDGGFSFKYETLPNIVTEECACL